MNALYQFCFFDLFVFAHVDAVSAQSVALNNDVFEERRNNWKSLSSKDSNTNATDEVKCQQQMTDRWRAHVPLANYADAGHSLDSSRNRPPVTSPSWILVFVYNDVNIFQSVK